MARAIGFRDRAIILRPLVDILDHQADRGAGRLALEHTGKNAHLIGFLPLRRMARLAATALVEIGLVVGCGQRPPRRATVDARAARAPAPLPPPPHATTAPQPVHTP